MVSGVLMVVSHPALAQGLPETATLTVPTARTVPGGSAGFGIASAVSEGAPAATPMSLVLGFARTLEVGVALDDIRASSSVTDTASMSGAIKWRVIDAWNIRGAVALLGSRPLATGGASRYGGGVRMGWEGLRSAASVSVERWESGTTPIGVAVERLVGSHWVLGLEVVGGGGTQGRGLATVRRAFGGSVTAAVGVGMRNDDGTARPLAVMIVGVVPRTAFLTARTPRPARPDADRGPLDLRPTIPDFEAAVARERAAVAAARAADSLQADRVVMPRPEWPLAAGRTAPTATWHWEPRDRVVPSGADIERLAHALVALRCITGSTVDVRVGMSVSPEAEAGLRRSLALLGLAGPTVTVARVRERPGAVDVTVRAPPDC